MKKKKKTEKCSKLKISFPRAGRLLVLVPVENRAWGKSGFMQEGNKEGGARKRRSLVGRIGGFGEVHVILFYSLDAHTCLALRTMWFFNDLYCFQGHIVRHLQFHVSHRSNSPHWASATSYFSWAVSPTFSDSVWGSYRSSTSYSSDKEVWGSLTGNC